VEVFSIRDPVNPVKRGYYRTGGYGFGLAVQEDIIWLADWYDGVYALRYDADGSAFVPGERTQNPVQYGMAQNYPNPFNGSTRIEYSLPKRGRVRVAVYDPAGRRVRTLFEAEQAAGPHRVDWDGRDGLNRAAASGVYFCRLEIMDLSTGSWQQDGSVVKVIRMVLIK